MSRKQRSAFTLIELLVVIAIIGLLAVLSIIVLSRSRLQARDAKRLSDITLVKKALDLYYDDVNAYPPLGSLVPGQSLSYTDSSTMLTRTYIDEVPFAPEVADGECTDYSNSYFYNTKDQQSYELNFCLGQPLKDQEPGPKCLTDKGVVNKACGPILQMTTYGGNYIDWSYNIVADNDYLYSSGLTRSERNGYQDGLITKYNRHNLQVVASKAYLGSNDTKSGFSAGGLQVDDQYVYALGRTNINSFGDTDALIVKYDKDLNIVDSKIFGTQFFDTCSNSYMKGDYIYLSCYQFTQAGTTGNSDLTFIKIDKRDLSLVSQKRLVMDPSRKESPSELEIVGDRIYVIGISYASSAYYDAFLFEMDLDFNLLRARQLAPLSGKGVSWNYLASDGAYLYASGRIYTPTDSNGDAILAKISIGSLDVEQAFQVIEPGLNSGGRIFVIRDLIYYTGTVAQDSFGNRGGSVKIINKNDLSIISDKYFGGSSNEEAQNGVVYFDGYIYANGSTIISSGRADDHRIVSYNTMPSGRYETKPSDFVYDDANYAPTPLSLQLNDLAGIQPQNGGFSIKDGVMTDMVPTKLNQGTTYVIE
jgi:prepilin-type N-terminal cleavage/methylation domain-containing protein